MSIVKSLAVGDGDMFYIRHNSDNFTIIDCSLYEENEEAIISELKAESADKGVTRFISTHPDDDHICGLCELDAVMGLRNFYCVANETTKPDWTADFERYGELRDDPGKAFHIYRGCSRRWMNRHSEERGSAGINILWPDTSNQLYKAELAKTKLGGSPNNISCIVEYSLQNGATIVWMGDLETTFMEDIETEVSLSRTDILFAPHHGRDTPPKTWLEEMDPGVIVIGEGSAEHQDPYTGYNKIRQNSAGDITFECLAGKTHIYVSNYGYSVDFLHQEAIGNTYGKYIGTLLCHA
jgi:beta-lactamase superfamily II metal-dependent hydrolase